MLSNFEPFQRLPPEIRLKIWQLTFPSFASSIKILVHSQSLIGPSNLWRRISAAKRDIPPLLHCCHESRALALEYYTLGFRVKSQWSGPGRDIHTGCGHDKGTARLNRQLYWDPKEDLVILGKIGEDIEGSCPPGAKCRSNLAHCVVTLDPDVRRIQINEESWRSFFREVKEAFPGLEDVTVILNNLFGSHGLPITEEEKSNAAIQQQWHSTWGIVVQKSMPPGVQSHIRVVGLE